MRVHVVRPCRGCAVLNGLFARHEGDWGGCPPPGDVEGKRDEQGTTESEGEDRCALVADGNEQEEGHDDVGGRATAYRGHGCKAPSCGAHGENDTKPSVSCGGLHACRIYELYGESGIGKTQLCLTACLACILPCQVGGNGVKALYLSTEGSGDVRRMADMLAMAEDGLRDYYSKGPAKTRRTGRTTRDPKGIQVMKVECKAMLERLLVATVLDTEVFVRFVKYGLATYVATNQVRLVVIDSIAAPLRLLPPLEAVR